MKRKDCGEFHESTRPRCRRRYHRIGRFKANGDASIVKLEETDIGGIEWKDLRLFFRPNDPSLHALRVKPSKTDIYGGPWINVFAIPPAPNQWFDAIQKKRERTKVKGELHVLIELFVEDLAAKKFVPYGNVIYTFPEEETNKDQGITKKDQNGNQGMEKDQNESNLASKWNGGRNVFLPHVSALGLFLVAVADYLTHGVTFAMSERCRVQGQ